MFHYDDGLKLTAIDLAIDMRRRQPRGFISHAHADHMAAHELAFCTPATARFYHLRMGRRPTIELPFGETRDWGDVRLTTLPAGHVLGSAMLLADDGRQSLLYTGDFRLGPSATAEPAEPPHADILVMESTFGDPRYRWPARHVVVGQLLQLVESALARDETPVIHAYVLGKAQEVTRLLIDAGFPVVQHPLVYETSRVYERCGCSMRGAIRHEGSCPPGHALVVPPRGQRAAVIELPRRKSTIAVTGWAVDASARHRLGVDHAVPLSDHADYDELLECIKRVDPQVICCTHGPVEFVDRLRALGLNAHRLEDSACGYRGPSRVSGTVDSAAGTGTASGTSSASVGR